MTDNNSILSYSSAEDEFRDERHSRLDRHSHQYQSNNSLDQDDRRRSHPEGAEDDFHRRRRPSQPLERSSSTTRSTVIALFGAFGPTGHHFLRLALDAGYQVRALVAPGTTLEHDFDGVTSVKGSLQDADKVQEVVYGSTFVVCMLVGCETMTASPDYPKNTLLQFTKLLYPMMTRQDDPPIQVFLFQASSLASDGHGKAPLLTKMLKTVTTRYRTDQLNDMNAVISYIHSRHRGKAKLHFPYIVTRPPTGALRDGPSTKKMAASKSVRLFVCLFAVLECRFSAV